MKEIIEILDRLRELSGNEQLDYLKSHADNVILREVLWYAYNPDLKYNISEAKLDKASAKTLTTQDIRTSDYTIIGKDVWNSYKNLLNEFANSKGVKDADISRLYGTYFTHVEQKSKELLRGVLLKDLRINMGVISFNKVWKDFYFKYPYMGARPFSEKALSKIKYPAICQTKMDGLYCNAIVDITNKSVNYVSRQGKPIAINNSLDNDLLQIKAKEKFVLNGEILVWNKETNKPYPREIGNGIINKDNKTQDELDAIRYVCWDFIPYEYFVNGGVWEVPYSARFNALKQMAQSTNGKMMLVDTEIANNQDEVLAIFERKYSEGEEGIVVKNFSQNWVNGKPAGQVKVKSEKDCDLEMVEFIEGNGAYSGMCGSIRCISNDEKLEVYIKPRTIQNAIDIWENKDYYMNKILAVRYNAKIKSPVKELYSLYLPRFVEVRTDKSIADTLEQIS